MTTDLEKQQGLRDVATPPVLLGNVGRPLNNILVKEVQTPQSDDSNGITPSDAGQTVSAASRLSVGGNSFIIEGDEYLSKLRKRMVDVLTHKYFEAAIGCIILFNSVTIGLELDARMDGRSLPYTTALENVFLVIYCGELALRFFVMKLTCLQDVWVRFDLLLVVVGVITAWIIDPFFGEWMKDEGSSGLGVLMVLRTGRLFRLARALRVMKQFHDLWMLVKGLLHSGKIMVYTLGLMVLMLYIFSCIACEIVQMGGSTDEEYNDVIQTYFRSVPISMLTLVQFICLDSVASIYKPLIEANPLLMLPYFMALILVVGIVLMNLITAVIVNGALEQAAQDKEMQLMHEKSHKEKMVKYLRNMFLRLDEDCSGSLTLDEVENIPAADLKEINSLLPGEMDTKELFQILDHNGSKEIPTDDFLDGLYNLSVSDTPLYITRLKTELEDVKHRVVDQSTIQADMVSALGDIRSFMQQMAEQDASMAATVEFKHKGLFEAPCLPVVLKQSAGQPDSFADSLSPKISAAGGQLAADCIVLASSVSPAIALGAAGCCPLEPAADDLQTRPSLEEVTKFPEHVRSRAEPKSSVARKLRKLPSVEHVEKSVVTMVAEGGGVDLIVCTAL